MAINWISKVNNGIKRFNSSAATLSGLILLFITLSIFVDVFLRYFFNQPSIWITEVSTYLFLYMIFLGTAYALQEGMHIRVTFILNYCSDKVVHLINLFTTLLAFLFALALLWQTSIMTWTSFEEEWTSPTMLDAPYAYIYLAMVVGSIMLVVTFLGSILSQLLGEEHQN